MQEDWEEAIQQWKKCPKKISSEKKKSNVTGGPGRQKNNDWERAARAEYKEQNTKQAIDNEAHDSSR